MELKLKLKLELKLKCLGFVPQECLALKNFIPRDTQPV